MLRASGIDANDLKLIEEDLPAAGTQLLSAECDTAFLVLPTEAALSRNSSAIPIFI